MAPDWTFWVLWSIFGVAASGFVPYFLSQKQPHLALWCGFAVFVIGSLAVTLHIRNDLIRKEHPETVFMNSDLSGLLIPDNKPTPPNACGTIPADSLALFFGNSVAYTSTFPHTVIEVGSEPILVINRQHGKVAVSGKVFSRDGRIVAELKDNRFYVNPNNYFRVERPSSHSLIVYDQEARQALNVEYLNASAIKVLGRFYLPNRPPVLINEDSQVFGGISMSRNCFGNNGVDIHLG